jgi:glutamate dehydrogenase (NAD(P)+)
MRFGRMTKKWDELGKSKLVELVENNANRQLTKAERKNIIQGAEERDLVYSGLEDTMIEACHETRSTAISKVSIKHHINNVFYNVFFNILLYYRN